MCLKVPLPIFDCIFFQDFLIREGRLYFLQPPIFSLKIKRQRTTEETERFRPMRTGKRKNIDSLEGITLGDEPLTLSVAQALGREPPPPVSLPDSDKTRNRETKDDGLDISSLLQVTLHRESSGRGGKTVTRVTIKPLLNRPQLELLGKTLRKALGCGSHLEGEYIVLQGDIPERAREWFQKQGARKVVRGN